MQANTFYLVINKNINTMNAPQKIPTHNKNYKEIT